MMAFLMYTLELNFVEVPEIPFGLKVLDKSGRTVQLSWLAPYDGNSLITRYIVEYKLLKGKCVVKILFTI